MTKIIERKNNHLRTRTCDCCGSTIEYNVNSVAIHSSAEDGFGGDEWFSSIVCPNCKHLILW